jgi:signal peptidase
LNAKNQTVSFPINRRKKKHTKSIDCNSAQSSVLSPQSSIIGPHCFEQVCTELLREGHQIKFRAPGTSMHPTICNGDLITIAPLKPSDIITGDIILYRHKNGVVAHRVINLINSQSSALSPQHLFTFRGDAAPVFDDPVGADQILGKVVSIERNGRCIDPYRFRATLHYKARRTASRLKRFFFKSVR